MDELKLKHDLDKMVSLKTEFIKRVFSEAFEEITYSEKPDDGDVNQLIYDYQAIKAEIMLELTSSNKIPKIVDPELRKELKDFLVDGDPLITYMKKNGYEKEAITGFKQILKPEFSNERLKKVIDELLHSWFNPSEFIYRLIDTAPIVIKNIEIPDELDTLINEVRQCIAFQNYLAAGIMLRTIAEIAVNDILKKNYDPMEDHTFCEKLRFLRDEPRFSIPAGLLESYRKDLNKFVHGNRIIDKGKIHVYLDIVLNQVQELYEKSE